MKTKILLTVILSIVLVSCAPVSSSTPAETLVLMATITLTPIPPTPTATPVPSATPIPTEAALQDGDIRTVTENGYTYTYRYSGEYGQWMREIANFPLLDYPYDNFVPYRVIIFENVQGERNIFAITHKDDTPGYGLNENGTYDPMPIKATLGPKLRDRYFAEDDRQLSDREQQSAIYDEMLGKGEGNHQQAYLQIITSDGNEVSVKLSQNSGIILTIMDKDTLFNLAQDDTQVGIWYIDGIAFYSEVYGVDSNGNMLCRLATDGSIVDLSDEALRKVLLSFPAHLVEHKDRREHGVTLFTQALVFMSTKIQPDGVTPDMVIERVP